MNPIVIIGFAEALSAPEVVWSLVDAGCTVRAFGRKGQPSALRHSRHTSVVDVTPPEKDSAATVQEVSALGRQLITDNSGRPVVIFPLDDAAVWLGDRVVSPPTNDGSTPVLAGPSNRSVALALDKAVQVEAARAAGFKVPVTRILRTKADAGTEEINFPIILKPAEAIVWREGRLRKVRNWICANQQELDAAMEGWGESVPLLLQPFVRGTGEGVFGMALPDGPAAISAHRRVRMMNPHGSGSSACVSQAVPSDVKHAAEQFIRQTGWRGLFMIELLRDQNGKAWFMEFNGRPWGSIALARRQGFEYPAWNVRLALDPQWRVPSHPLVKPGLVCRNAGRELMYPLFVLRGPKSDALQHWPGFWRSVAEIARVNSRHVFYNWRRDDARVFVSDCIYTLRSNLLKSKR